MIEALSYKRNIAKGLAVLAGVAALNGCGANSNTNKASECIGVGFGSAKGGPGLIAVNVYPILKDGFAATRVTGEVTGGNDKGAVIKDNSAVFAGAGEFFFSWDNSATAVQTSTVEVSAVVAGKDQLQKGPTTTMRFDPTTTSLSPTYK